MKRVFLIAMLLLAGCGGGDKPPVPVPPQPAPPAPQPEPPKYSTGLVKDPDAMYGELHFITKPANKALPAEYDWREHGGVTPVRNQGNCGCCWAFGTTQSHEVGVKIFQKKDIDFSEQQLCGSHFYKCNGGDFDDVWIVKNGQAAEADCKYTATSKACPANLPVANKPTASGYVGSPNARPTVEQLKNAIVAYGAVSVYVCGGNSPFMNAGTGLVEGPNCQTDHIVAIMGWKDVNGKTYWLVKNSWGTQWADKGYGWIAHGSFNIAERAKWIAVEKAPCVPPYIRLPKKHVVGKGDTVVVAADDIAGVTYEWFNGAQKLGDKWFVKLSNVTVSFTLTLKIKHECGDGEIPTQIVVEQRK